MSKKNDLHTRLQLLSLLCLPGLLFPPALPAQQGSVQQESARNGSVQRGFPREEGEGRTESAPGEPSREEKAPRRFTFSGDSTSISFAEGKQRTLLTGNAALSSEELDIEAQRIELYGKDFRYARCSEEVRVKNTEQKITLTANTLFYDRDLEFLRIRGYTEMVDMNNELVIKCGYLEHYDREEYSIFQIGVRILKATEDGRMVCRSDFARYDRREDLLELTGSPIVYWKGDRYSAVRITINLESDEITMRGDVEGEFTSENESS